MNILEVKNLNLGFETEAGFKQALFDVSFALKKGEMHALVGESGCGKTISAMSILRLLPKTAKVIGGEILFYEDAKCKMQNAKCEQKTNSAHCSLLTAHSVNLLTLPPKEIEQIRGAKIALIPQDPMTSLNPLYTIGNQLLEVIEKHQGLKGKEAQQKAVEALELVQIPSAKERLGVYPHEFSGGMKQRAIIAMALACNAQIIIADEPTTALDVTIQAGIMKILDNIKKELGTSILLITHDLALVEDCADMISVMYAGKIMESAPTKEFFTNPTNPYSKALLKSLPSNKGEKLMTIEGQPPTIQQNIQGCKFNPRCEFVMDICPNAIPQLIEITPNHFCACHLNS
jgi:oligopeptide/dipeptide ABC transporter ATP-binding protein